MISYGTTKSNTSWSRSLMVDVDCVVDRDAGIVGAFHGMLLAAPMWAPQL